jgi:rfaE bifunctional protein kinase chain/domain
MTPERFQAITAGYPSLRVAVLGDFCLDRYLEIDPARQEISLETGLAVHNVVNVRAQPGGAGTILNNLSALGVGTLHPIGFAGHDGEGFELWHALQRLPGVSLKHFLRTAHRRTFTYCKPLVLTSRQAPVELNRLDLKNWTPTPALVQGRIIDRLQDLAGSIDGLILMDQVDVPDTGVVTQKVVATLNDLMKHRRDLLVLADSRRGLRGFSGANLKMNTAELRALTGAKEELSLDAIKEAAAELARRNRSHVLITLAERGLLGATPEGQLEHVPALPVRGEIDIVGAGDAVSANIVAARLAGAGLRETLEIASAAASVVIHKLGTTGTASVAEIAECLFGLQ